MLGGRSRYQTEDADEGQDGGDAGILVAATERVRQRFRQRRRRFNVETNHKRT